MLWLHPQWELYQLFQLKEKMNLHCMFSLKNQRQYSVSQPQSCWHGSQDQKWAPPHQVLTWNLRSSNKLIVNYQIGLHVLQFSTWSSQEKVDPQVEKIYLTLMLMKFQQVFVVLSIRRPAQKFVSQERQSALNTFSLNYLQNQNYHQLYAFLVLKV